MGLVRWFHYLAFKLELIATGYIPHYAYIIIFAPIIIFITSYYLSLTIGLIIGILLAF
jgi:hypothetical protein